MDELFTRLDCKAGPARRISSAVASEMVRSVLVAALEIPEAPAHKQLQPPRKAPSRWGRVLAAAAAVLLAVSVGSGASAVALRLVQIELGSAELAPTPRPRPAIERRPVPERLPEPPVQAVAPPPAVEPEPVPDHAAPPPRRHVIRKKASRGVTQAPRRQAAPAPVPAPVSAHPPAPTPPAGEVVPENLPPSDLLAIANDRRTRKQWRAADIYYGAVVSRFTGSDAAVIAEVASAALHLQQLDDAAGALDAYHRTLRARPSGPLAEEARWGIAEARRRLGDADAEARALRDFLVNHPDSALAATARRRLGRLAP